jgi:hypothetical protein
VPNFASVPVLDFAVIKGIMPAKLATASHQSVYYMM